LPRENTSACSLCRRHPEAPACTRAYVSLRRAVGGPRRTTATNLAPDPGRRPSRLAALAPQGDGSRSRDVAYSVSCSVPCRHPDERRDPVSGVGHAEADAAVELKVL